MCRTCMYMKKPKFQELISQFIQFIYLSRSYDSLDMKLKLSEATDNIVLICYAKSKCLCKDLIHLLHQPVKMCVTLLNRGTPINIVYVLD